MVFELPVEFQKVIASTTAKVYTSNLNKLASHGFDTVEKIQTEQKEVIKVIKEIPGNDEKSRLKRRVMMSAIFWAVPLPKKNQYHTYWQKNTPLKIVGDGGKWLKKVDYTG